MYLYLIPKQTNLMHFKSRISKEKFTAKHSPLSVPLHSTQIIVLYVILNACL